MKTEGSIVQPLQTTINVNVKPKDLPEKTCQDMSSLTEAATLQRALACSPTNPMGTICKPTGGYTCSAEEQFYLRYTFPGVFMMTRLAYLQATETSRPRAAQED